MFQLQLPLSLSRSVTNRYLYRGVESIFQLKLSLSQPVTKYYLHRGQLQLPLSSSRSVTITFIFSAVSYDYLYLYRCVESIYPCT